MTGTAYKMVRMTAIASEGRAWLTTSEVARVLRVDERTVRNHAGELGGINVGRQLRFPPDLTAPTLNTGVRGAHPTTERIR